MGSPCVNRLQKENFPKICRSCLTEAILGNMFETSYEQLSLATVLNEALLIKIDPNDELPKNLCEKCIAQIVESYNFRKKFTESDNVLRKILESEGSKSETENCEVVKLLNSEIKCYVDNCTTPEGLEFIRVAEKSQTKNKLEIFKILAPEVHPPISTDTRNFHLTIERNSCTITSFDIDTKTRVKKTLKSTHKTKPKLYTCYCGVNFVRWSEYIQHNRETRHNFSPEVCKICKRKFKNPESLRKHMTRKHDGEDNFICEDCGEIFHSKDAFIDHREKIHGEHQTQTKKPFICEYCGVAFRFERSFLKHKENHSTDNTVDCKICKKVFQNRNSLRVHHYNVHSEKNLLCVECGQKFSRHTDLQIHMMKHTGEKPYQCDYCDQSFRLIGGYRSHIVKHTAEKSFKCNVCSKGFRLRHHLKTHMFIHTGVKHLKCMHCDYSTFNNGNLKQHMWTHTGENPLKCKICEKRCASFKQLKVHKETCHGAEEQKEFDVVSFFNSNK